MKQKAENYPGMDICEGRSKTAENLEMETTS